MTRRLRVGILFGGRSAEHEISLLSARNVLAALDRDRFEPVLIGVDRGGRWLLQEEALVLGATRDPRLIALNNTTDRTVSMEPRPTGGALVSSGASSAAGAEGLRALDVIFPVLHGPMGEDGTMQGLLELADVAYVGTGVLGSAVGMDKDVMKRLLRDAGIPIAAFRVVKKHELARDRDRALASCAELGFPLFTKPANMGSSVGVRKVKSPGELEAALLHAFEFDLKVIVEENVEGREIECSVLGNDDPIASIAGEIEVRHADGFYSYEAKYVDESGAVLTIPAALPEGELEIVRALSVRTFLALEGSGLTRVDMFRRARDGAYLVNEVNTMPGFTAISMYPKLWEASGITQRELVSRLIDLAIERKEARRALKVKA